MPNKQPKTKKAPKPKLHVRVYTTRKLWTNHLIRSIFHYRIFAWMSDLQTDLAAMLMGTQPPTPKKLNKLAEDYAKVNELLEFLDPIVGTEGCRQVLDTYEHALGQRIVVGRDENEPRLIHSHGAGTAAGGNH